MKKIFNLNEFQTDFVLSEERYPAMVSAWGTGKTLCGILKGMGLSEMYSDNLGVIFRKEYTDLRDSTIRDFQTITGLTVSANRDIILPCKSTILFRHLEEINNIQNMNLGWFLIEQAEELESDQEFTMLRGRLRRENCRHCGMIIANTKGHNWIYKNWKLKNLQDSFLVEAKTEDNKAHLPQPYLADLEKLKITNPKTYNRFCNNSWEEDDTTDVIISAELVQNALYRILRINNQLKRVVSIDVARYGDDKTVMYALENNRIVAKQKYEKKDTMETVGRAVIFAEKNKGIRAFAVDEIGVGAGVVDRLKELGKEVIAVNSSKKSDYPEKYYNTRAEIYGYGAELFSNGDVQVDPDDKELIEQLSWAKYKTIKSSGLYQVEAKEDIKERYGKSPDEADAFLNGLWALRKVKETLIPRLERDRIKGSWHSGNYTPKTIFEKAGAR